MNEDSLTWQQHVEKADAHKALGHTEVYLWRRPLKEYPWHLAESCRPGGSHRFEISTDVTFYGTHEKSGLRFRWSFDIEPRSANGKPGYEIDVSAIAKVLSLLPADVALEFKDYLKIFAGKIMRRSRECEEEANRQFATADVLNRLTKE